MNKRKTLKEQKFSLKNIPHRNLKPNAKVITVSASKRLSNKDLIFQSLWECLIEQDLTSFKEILRAHIEAVGVEELTKKSKTSKRTIYRTLSENGNPTLKSISQILSGLYS